MLTALKNITGRTQPSASVVDGKLILSFPDALTPVVWQMDLDQVKASALEVLNNEKENHFTLTLKTPKGEKLDAAKFETREDAVQGLICASRALESAHGRIKNAPTPANQDKANITPTTQSASHPKQGKTGRWVTAIMGILLLVILFGFWSSIAPQTPTSYRPQGTASPTASAPRQNTSAATSSGVPVSADDFLNGL